MKSASRLTVLAFVSLFLVPSPGTARQEAPAVTIRVSASEIANLTYQLDCLAGLTHGSTDSYRELWRKELGWTAADDAAVERWREARERYRNPVPILDAAIDDLDYPDDLFGSGALDLGRRLRIAGLRAQDVAGYRRDVTLLTLPEDAGVLSKTLERFRERFSPWWSREAKPQLDAFAAGLSRLIADRRLDRLTASVARFYGVPLDGGLSIDIHLIARPRLEGKTTFGEQVENHALVEVLPGEQPDDRVDVVFHELFHYLYGRMPDERKLALRRRFLQSGDAAALATFNVFDEAIATALGNGHVLRLVKGDAAMAEAVRTDGAFYNDPFIERVAKGILPTVESRLASGESIDAAFVDTYISEAAEALGPDRMSPLLALKMYALVFESHELRALHGPFARAVRPRLSATAVGFDAESRQLFEKHPQMSGAIFVTTSGLDGLHGWEAIIGTGTLERVRTLANQHAAFVYGVKRGPRATIYLFVGRDAESLGKVLDQFGRSNEPFDGPKFTRS